MGSRFLQSNQQTLTDGTAQINIQSAVVQSLLPNLPVRTTTGKMLSSGLIQLSDCAFTPTTSPFPGTFQVEDLETAYNTTPVSLNAFIASTLTDISTLQSNTQYISATPGLTTIASNLATDDIKANQYQDPTGSTFIDMSTPGDVNVSATTFEFNGDPVLTSASGGFLKLDGTSTMTGDLDMGGNDIINTASISPALSNVNDIGTFLNEYKDIYLGGNIIGSTKTSNVNNIVSNAGAGATGTIPTFVDASGKVIQNSGVDISSVTGGPFVPRSGATGMLGNLDINAFNLLNVAQMTTSSAFGDVIIGNGASTNNTAGSIAIGKGCTGTDDGVAIGQNCIAPFASICIGNQCTSANAADVCIGFQAKSTLVSVGNSVSVGNTSLCNNGRGVAVGDHCTAGAHSICMGYAASANSANSISLKGTANFDNSIAIGASSIAGATGAIALGVLANNTVQNSCLIGASNIVHIRPNNTNTCDIGSTGNRFNNAYVNNFISPTVTKSVDNLFLKTGTVAMTGQLDFGNNDGINTNRWQSATVAGNCIWGSGTTISVPAGGSNIRNNYIGYNNDATGFGINAIGNECHQSAGAGDVMMIGSGIGVTGSNCSAMGDTININGSNCVAIGTNVGCTGNNTYIIGAGATNSTANSMLLGSSNIVNIRPNGNAVTDLGTSGAQYKDAYLSGIVKAANMDTQGATFMSIGTVNATQVVIGKTLGDVIISGELNTRQGFGAWYSSTSYLPSFTAGTARFIPPTAQTSGTLSEFTNASLGILTYTGGVARACTISYNISFTAGASTANMTFFNSRNLSLVIGAGQARQFIQVTPSNNATQMCVSFTDNVVLAPGDTVQLAAICATSSAAVSFNFISCNIRRMFE